MWRALLSFGLCHNVLIELVVLALADSGYDVDMKSQLAARLVATTRLAVF